MAFEGWRWTALIILLTTLAVAGVWIWRRLPLTFRNGRFTWNVSPDHNMASSAKNLYHIPLAIDIEGLQIWISGRRLHVRAERVRMWLCVADKSGTTVTVRAIPSRWRRKAVQLLKAVVAFLSRQLVLVIANGVIVRVCSRGNLPTTPERLYYLQLELASVTAAWTSGQENPLHISAIRFSELCQAPDKTEQRNIIAIDRISLKRTAAETVLDLGERITVDISCTLMMTVGSFLDRKPRKIVKGRAEESRPFKLEIPLPNIVARLRALSLILTLHIPIFDPELHCLDHAQVTLRNVSGQLFIREMKPYFCLDVERAALSSRYLDVEERAAAACSRAEAIWGQYRDGEAELLVLENLCISDYGKTDFGLEDTQIAKYIEEMRDGKGPWWWRHRPGFREDEYSRQLDGISTSLSFDVDRAELNEAPYEITILATMDALRIYFPSEFPFGYLFDEIIYIYKAAMMGEAWDVISTAAGDFVLRLSARTASVVFGDDEIDVAIGRVLMCKKVLAEKVKVKGGTEPEEMFNEYVQICEEYMSQIHDNDLLQLSGSDIVFQVRWKQAWSGTSEGIVKLLRGISEEQELSVPLLLKMDTLVGGHVEFSTSDLSVGFRDYALPMLSAPKVRGHGLLFVLALLPEREAVQRVPLSVYPLGPSSNLTRAPFGDSFVLKNANPVKIFHCASFVAHGPKMAHIAFSPRWLPAFQQMDRITENFASPAADPSPILPVWDKVRFLLRGTFTCLTVRSPCHFDLLLGENLQSVEERLTFLLPAGARLEQGPKGRVELDTVSALIAASSQQLYLLKHHLSAEGACFAKYDKRESLYLGESSIFLGALSQCKIRAQFKLKNHSGEECIDHFAVKTVVKEYAQDNHDTFKDFRADHIYMKVSVEKSAESDVSPQSRLALSYYRELEEWLANSLARIIDIPCKKGSLWRTAFVPQHRPFDIKRYLRDISVRIQLQHQPLELRLLSFHSVDQYSGVRVCASGFEVYYHWRRHRNLYRTVLGEWVIADGRIACFASNVQQITSEYAVGIVEGIAGIEIVRAPIISFNSVNETLYSLQDDLDILQERIGKLEKSREDLKGERRHGSKRRLDFMTAHISYLTSLLKQLSDGVGVRMTKGRYTAYDPNLSWDEDSRDTVYTIIYQQGVREECHFARSRKMERLIDTVAEFFEVANLEQREEEEPETSTGKPSGIKTPTPAEVDVTFQDLMNYVQLTGKTKMAEPDFANVAGRRSTDLRSPMDLLSQYDAPFFTSIQLVNPQIALAVPIGSEDEPVKARSILLAVPEVLAESCQFFKQGEWTGDPSDRPIGRRTKLTIANAQLFVVPADHEGSVFFSSSSTPPYRRVTDQISISGVHDICFSAARREDPIFYQGKGDAVRTQCPSFALRTNSTEFQAIINCILRLFVRRDAYMSERAARKTQIYDEAIAGKTEALQSLAAFVVQVKGQCDEIDAELAELVRHGDSDEIEETLERLEERQLELSVLAEALTAMKSEQEKFTTRQTKLTVEANLEEAAWTLLDADGARMAGIVLQGVNEEWLNEADGSMGTVFEVGSITADAGSTRILEQLTPKLAKRLQVEIPGLSQAQSSVIRFSFKAAQAKSVGGQRSIEHAELHLAPLRINIEQEQATRLFYYFFPDSDGFPSTTSASSTGTTAKRQKGNIEFTSILVPASCHLLTFRASSGSEIARTLMDITDFPLHLPDIEYTNQTCTWDELAVKLRNDAILILLSNAGTLIKQKFQSSTAKMLPVDSGTANVRRDAVKELYREEPLPIASDEEDEPISLEAEEDRRQRVQEATQQEQEEKGRFLFGRYYH